MSMPIPAAAIATHAPDIPAGHPLPVDPEPGTLPSIMPVRRRSQALALLACIAVIFALEWAQSFFISLLLGILFAYALNPLVVWLERIKIPRAVATSFVMAGVVCALGVGAYALRGQMQTILDQLPEAVSKLSAGLSSLRHGQDSTMQKMQTAASEIEKAANQVAGTATVPKQQAARVLNDQPGFKFSNFLWEGSRGVAGLIGQAIMIIFLTFFLLLSGDTYKRKLLRLTGPSLSDKKITVRILEAINESIQRYMLMLLATNVLVGLLTWVALRWIGLENAGAWGVAAGLLHVIPYIGPAVTAAGIGLAAFMQFDAQTGLLVAAASLGIATVVGHLVTTWVSGKIARMNTAAVFVSLLFWGWLWGVWGLLLSVPITAIVKVVAQHVEQLEPVAELLGE